jgi:adenine-specific DNA-methyltransferase
MPAQGIMAKIEQLVGTIGDQDLRDQIAREVKALKERKQFGLVFERHLPETILIAADAKIRAGSRARRRTAPDGPDLTVVRATRTSVVLAGDDGEIELPRSDVLVVQPFEEPVYPTLRLRQTVARSETRPYHAVINGENFHTLQLLVHAFEGQVDCIYIDPPYNSGASTWKYNNKFVDENDSWFHSKWLSFMEKRLRIAKRLLKPDGVLVVTIDENEVHHLGLLLEEMFPEFLRYMVTIVINPKGTSKANFSRVDEYAFFICPPGTEVISTVPFGFAMPIEVAVRDHRVLPTGDGNTFVRRLALRRDGAESSNRADRPKQFYALLIDPKTNEVKGIGPQLALTDEPRTDPIGALVPVYPIDGRGRHRVWRYGRDTMTALIEAGEIRITKVDPRTGRYSLYHIKPVEQEAAERRRPRTVWWHSSHDAGAYGATLLNEMFGQRSPFPFPKSLYAVRDTLKLVVGNKPDALVIDFFAGSGTTMHATCVLNAEDGGRRRSIMVTNNEVSDEDARALAKAGHFPGDPEYEARGIFESVTMPRCISAVTGERPDGTRIAFRDLDGSEMGVGLDENVAFFNLDYLNPDRIELGEALDDLLPVIWLAAGGRGGLSEAFDREAGYVVDEARGLAILLDEKGLRGFEDALEATAGITTMFVVSDSEAVWLEVSTHVGIDRETGRARRIVIVPRDYLTLCRKIARSFR